MESTTEQEMASTFNFLNKKLMVADCVVLELNNYEKKAVRFFLPWRIEECTLKQNTRALLISWIVGESC